MENNIFDLSGKTIILTGGLGMLGRTFTRSLLDFGANLILLDLVEENKVSAILSGFIKDTEQGRVKYFKVDIANQSDLLVVNKKIMADFGRVDVLINNAAINPMVKIGNVIVDNSFEKINFEDWQTMSDVNVKGAMLCAQIFGSEMSSGGSIINISSVYGVQAPDQRIYERGFIKSVFYTVTKGSLIAFTKYLAAYWGTKGIRVNCISPGGVLADQGEEFIKKYSERVPLGRMCRAEELCGSLVFLSSSASSYVNGENIVVDGGLTIW